MQIVRGSFKPEFINRIDEFMIFEPLKKSEIQQIILLQLKRLTDRLKEQQLNLSLTEKALDYFSEKGYDPLYGARPAKRLIQQVNFLHSIF